MSAVTIALMGWLATRGPADVPGGGIENLVITLATGLPLAALWWIAAAGWGALLMRGLDRERTLPWSVRVAAGAGGLLWLDALLGALGLLQVMGGVIAWGLLALGVIALGWSLRAGQRHALASGRPLASNEPAVNWGLLAWCPAVAVLLTAASSAPGWLWGTEFGGFDALSYHLQGPKEWLAEGRLRSLEHNVYTALPGYVEAAYYHLMILRGDAVMAAVACQLLHAGATILAAWLTMDGLRVIAPAAHPLVRSLAGALVLGTPWTIVVGSLAYNEMFCALMLAAALITIAQPARGGPSWATGALLGFFTATACGAKLTSVGFVLLPIMGLAAVMIPPRRWALVAGTAAVMGFVILSPWLGRNLLAFGQPVFPFLPDLFGQAHWEADQFLRWRAGHIRDDLTLMERLAATWRQLFIFGFGTNPAPGEPWARQWSLLMPLALASAIVLCFRRLERGWTLRLLLMLALGWGFWMSLTHLQSRFMVPLIAAPVLLMALGFHALFSRMTARPEGPPLTARVLLIGIALLVSLQPMGVFLGERSMDGRGQPAAWIGFEPILTGNGLSTREQELLAAQGFIPVFVNHLLPPPSTPGARLVFIGAAKPFYFDVSRITYGTVWDTDPVRRAIIETLDEPGAGWIDRLRREGVTHVLLGLDMLERWRDSGYLDPRIDPARIADDLAREGRLLLSFGPSGQVFALSR